MKLLLITSEFPPGPGGIGEHAHQLSCALFRRGWTVGVVTPQDHAAEAEVAAFNGAQPFRVVRLRRHRVKPIAAVYRSRALSAAVRAEQPDLLMASGQRAVWVAAAVARKHGLPWVAVGHGSEFNPPTVWERIVNRRAFGQASAVICVSDFTRALMERMGARPTLVRTIPNGADAGRFHVLLADDVLSVRAQPGPAAGPRLLTVGNVTERKGQEVVIRALPEVLRSVPGTQYLLAGLPTRRAEYESLARALGVHDHVHFLGRVGPDDIVRHLNACDLFVMTSRTTRTGDCEGYGIAVVEAALCGKPAVVSRGSGLSEAIVDGVTGLAVPEGDPSATAAAVVALLRDPPRREAMGAAALRRAASEQTWDHRAARYDSLFREVLGGGASRPVARRRDAVTVP